MTRRAPLLEHVLHLEIGVGPAVEVGPLAGGGVRRVVPILGGTVSGVVDGTVVPGGSDVQWVRTSTMTELDARYVLRLSNDATVFVHSAGVRIGSTEDMDRLRQGLPVDQDAIYFRGTPRFETSAPGLRRLVERVHVAVGERHADRVVVDVFEVT